MKTFTSNNQRTTQSKSQLIQALAKKNFNATNASKSICAVCEGVGDGN